MSDSLLFWKFKPGYNSSIYKFEDPDTGYKYSAASRKDLVKSILLYRHNNQLAPIDNLPEVLDHYLCTLPENSGKCCRDVALNRGFIAAVKGGIMLLKSMAYKTWVTQEVADDRAAQCSTCKYNVFPDKTGFIKYTDNIALHSIGSKKTKYNNELGNCEVCTCVLKVKVWFDGSINPSPEELEKFEEVDCWQLQLPREQ